MTIAPDSLLRDRTLSKNEIVNMSTIDVLTISLFEAQGPDYFSSATLPLNAPSDVVRRYRYTPEDTV